MTGPTLGERLVAAGRFDGVDARVDLAAWQRRLVDGFDTAPLTAAFARLAGQIAGMTTVMERRFAELGKELFPLIAAERKRQQRARAAYLRRAARGTHTLTTSPAFRAGTRRTKQRTRRGR